MRWAWLLLLVIGCGGAPTPAPAISTPEQATARTRAAKDRAAADPIAALAPIDDADTSWLAPGDAHLELGTPPIQGPGPTKPLSVTIIDEHGNLVRVAIRLEHARFSLWTDRTRLFGVLVRDERLSPHPGGGRHGDTQVTLRAGSRVKRLAHKDEWTQVRYSGAVEAEGWVPDVVLGEAGPPHVSHGRHASGHRTLMVMQGAIIRSEPTWSGSQLAVMANGYFLDNLRQLDDAWTEVAYSDSDVTLRGFVSKRAPPGRVHRKRADPEVAPVAITPNTKVAGGTCLYTRMRGDAVGYLVGEQEVDLSEADAGWFNLAIDTPWGPITFAARGSSRADLRACGPVAPAAAPPVPAPSVP